MALVNKWPKDKEEFYDNKQWEAKEWTIGEPITKEKLQKMDDGIAVLATQVKAILGEFNPSSLDGAQLNASRLDKNDNKIAAIASELGGTAPDGNSTTYSGTTRLDDLEKELCGENITRDTQNGGYLNSRLDNIQEWITGSNSNSYDGEDNIAARLDAQNNSIEDIKTWIVSGSGYQNDNDIDSRLGTVESSIENLGNRVDNDETDISSLSTEQGTIKTWIVGNSTYDKDISITSRIDTLESNIGTLESNIGTLEGGNESLKSDINNLKDSNYEIKTWITGGNIDYTGPDLNTRVGTVESIIGDGVIGYTNLTEAINTITEIEDFNDLSAYREILNYILQEIWGDGKTLSNINYNLDSRIDTLNNQINSANGLLKQTQTLTTKQNTLEQNLAATNAKIPIEMYVATNSNASDTLVIDALPHDKSIFFIAIPYGTQGIENLKLQTSDIQFVDEIGQLNYITLKKNYVDPVKVKYPQNSIISIYRKDEKDLNDNITSSNAYIVNMPMVL